ncbi:alpha/beta fold hydrolase [Nonomuraea sp. NN258]|uniref:alpha/beta fold hydrolase n=1 Tax=Nonomuraea antri TaxID=2730852 RepID=UPI0015685768|nr:alpha/beta fold hydrolase [Nonomuraea antri]NRQ33794.1 alpha/beta fold hydrolase [Nonomuraea antri]
MTAGRNVILVPGALADGSGWQGVQDELAAAGLRVHVARIPMSPAGDVALTRRLLDGLDGPAVLVGHCYGGVVITEAGTHPRVASLVYLAAFVPDQGESIDTLVAAGPALPVPARGATVTDPAWRHRPSWYLVALQDRIIAPALQRGMAERAGSIVVEVVGSHAVHVTQPAAAADLIREAAAAVFGPAAP